MQYIYIYIYIYMYIYVYIYIKDDDIPSDGRPVMLGLGCFHLRNLFFPLRTDAEANKQNKWAIKLFALCVYMYI